MRTVKNKNSCGRIINLNDYRGTLPHRLDNADNELTGAESRLLQALALYRGAIPQTHRAMLEQHLNVSGAWAGLVSRGYIIADNRPWYVTLPMSIRNRNGSISPATEQQKFTEIHSAIASCWLEELECGKSAQNQARVLACEALHHLTEAGDDLRLRLIPVELLLNDRPWARQRLKKLYDTLYRSHVPIYRQRQLLQYRSKLDPENHAIHRFLGQCWQKEEGKGSRKAIACFETACRLKPDFAPYLTDLGHALLATGKAGAREFLARLELVARDCPTAINDYVNVVRIACLKMLAGCGEVVNGRLTEIQSGSSNPVFYADEAKAQLKRGNAVQALAVIAMAEQRGCGNDIIAAIKAAALEKLGRKDEAAALRLEKIALGSRNPAFYSDAARAKLKSGDPDGALAILALALEKGLGNDYIVAIRATALERTGRAAEAAAIRMVKISSGSRNCVFYNDEANVRIMAGNFAGAREMLELAVKNNCANQVTSVLWAKAERMASLP